MYVSKTLVFGTETMGKKIPEERASRTFVRKYTLSHVHGNLHLVARMLGLPQKKN
jgi:hypothetical protein